MLGRPHPEMPMTLHEDELPTAAELARLRHPEWFARAGKMLVEGGIIDTAGEPGIREE
jgi:hypothetical protein